MLLEEASRNDSREEKNQLGLLADSNRKEALERLGRISKVKLEGDE